jgi:hypothetical protein
LLGIGIGIDSSKEAIFTTIERFTKGVEPMGDFVTKKKSSTPKEIDVETKQLTLFNEIDQDLIPPSPNSQITNFALYANEFWADDLKTINLNS